MRRFPFPGLDSGRRRDLRRIKEDSSAETAFLSDSHLRCDCLDRGKGYLRRRFFFRVRFSFGLLWFLFPELVSTVTK